jgi:Spy/CpxP family protein refolding chaperone
MNHTALSASLLASALVLACSGAVTTDPSMASGAAAANIGDLSNVEVTRAPVGAAARGRVKRIGDALGQVALRGDQRAQLEALAADADGRLGVGLAAKQDLATALAAQVAAGTIDRAALAPKVTAMVAAMTAAQAKDRAAFEAVHGILDAGQRAEFVDAMEQNPHAGHGWDMVNHRGPGQRWADELSLSDDQRATFEQILHDSFAGHHHGDGPGFLHGMGHGKALLEAFRADAFSFDAASPAEDIGGKTSGMVAHLLDVAEKVLPILTPEQRALAAKKILEHAGELPVGP